MFGENHPIYATSLNNLGVMYYKQGNYSKASNYFLESFNIRKHNFIISLEYMTEYERALFWETIHDDFEYTYPLFAYNYHFTNPSISTFAYDNELFRKGLLLNSVDAVRRSILESGDSVLIEQWNELTDAKQVVMRMEEKEPTSSQLEIYRHRADSLEKQMTISSATFRESKEQWNINWERVKNNCQKMKLPLSIFLRHSIRIARCAVLYFSVTIANIQS